MRFLFESELLTRDKQIVDLSGANITRVNLNYAPLPDLDLKGAWLTWGTFLNADLRRANLSRTDLKEADLRGANLQGADLRGANLQEANLTDANLEKTDLRGNVLLNPDGTFTIKQTKLQGSVLTGSELNLKGACYDDNTMGLNMISQQHQQNMRYATEKERDIPCKDLP